MIDSLRKVAARLLGVDREDPFAGRPGRRTALDDVPHLELAYPGVDTVAITLRAESPDREHVTITHTRTFGPRSRADFRFRCKNPTCRHGGFDLTQLVHRAVEQQRDSVSGTEVCTGTETPHGTYQTRCMHELVYRIAISYRQN
ncbi:MAG: hypothetical protein AAFX85_12460 [Pseudomonadota bacterium]